MGLLGNNENKQEEKINKSLSKHHLQDISSKYAEQVKEINQELLGTGLMETGTKLSFAKAEEQLKISYLRTLVEQNWIIIRMLDELNKK